MNFALKWESTVGGMMIKLEITSLVLEIYGSPEPQVDLHAEQQLGELLYQGWEIIATNVIPTTATTDLIGYQIIVLKRCAE